jgi:putative ABC transport system permease protein
METFWQDLRYGVRALAQTPAFTIVAILTLGLGIGANAAIFSVTRAVLLSPLPYADTERTVAIWSRWADFDKTWVSEAELLDYRRARSLRDVGAWSTTQANLTGANAEPERVGAARVTPNVFTALGARPLHGRTFTPDEEVEGRDTVAILGHGLWQRRFGGDHLVLHRRIRVDGRDLTVVGIMPQGFQLPTDYGEDFAEPTELWIPLTVNPSSPERGNHGWYAAARLAPGVTIAQANEELRAITAARTREGAYPEAMRFGAFAVSLDDEILGTVRPRLMLLGVAVGFLLLIACANVASLLLARAEGRVREVAVRRALGAGHGRLVRQALTESLLLSIGGAACGLALAMICVQALASAAPGSIPRVGAAGIDGAVLLFALFVGIGTTAFFSIAPIARLVRLDPVRSLKEGGQSTPGAARQRFRQMLIAGEMALAVLLLVCAGLMVRSIWAMQQVPLGFDPRGVLTVRVALPEDSYSTNERIVSFYERVTAAVRELPGVTAAGAVRSLPLASTIGDWGLDVEGFVETPGRNAKGDWQVVTPGAFEALGERVVSGRGFTAADRGDARQVALVNETMAARYWSDGNPIGRRIRMGSDGTRPWITVVGVVQDVRHNGITTTVKEKFYIPHAQFHLSTGFAPPAMTLVIRTDGDPRDLASPVRRAVAQLDPSLPVSGVRPMTDVVADTMAPSSFTGLLLALFAALAVVLAAIGIYGLLSYLVSQRTREIGIRMAIGASHGNVVSLVLRKGLLLTGCGVAAGLALAFGATRLMQALLYGVGPLDLVTFAAVPAILLVVAVAASYLPAARAARVSPLLALRSD